MVSEGRPLDWAVPPHTGSRRCRRDGRGEAGSEREKPTTKKRKLVGHGVLGSPLSLIAPPTGQSRRVSLLAARGRPTLLGPARGAERRLQGCNGQRKAN